MSHTAAAEPHFVLVARDIKLSHSVFALPFAVLAGCLAWPTGKSGAVWMFAAVVACMVTARTWAMLVNRLADRTIFTT